MNKNVSNAISLGLGAVALFIGGIVALEHGADIVSLLDIAAGSALVALSVRNFR